MLIRHRWAAGETEEALADEYGVMQPTINALVRGRSYKRLPLVRRAGADNIRRGEGHRGATITKDQAKEIKRLLARGLSRQEVAATLGVRRSVVDAIAHEKTWKDVHLGPLDLLPIPMVAPMSTAAD